MTDTKALIKKIAENRVFNIGGYILALGSLILLGAGIYTYNKNNKDAKDLYRQTLFQNADSNKDGFISGVEKSNFDSQLFKGKNVYFEGDELKYENGNSVTSDKIIQWINNYNK